MFELKIVKSSDSFELEVKLIRLVIFKLKRVDSSSSLKSELELVRRIIIKFIRSLILI